MANIVSWLRRWYCGFLPLWMSWPVRFEVDWRPDYWKTFSVIWLGTEVQKELYMVGPAFPAPESWVLDVTVINVGFKVRVWPHPLYSSEYDRLFNDAISGLIDGLVKEGQEFLIGESALMDYEEPLTVPEAEVLTVDKLVELDEWVRKLGRIGPAMRGRPLEEEPVFEVQIPTNQSEEDAHGA